ncbi:MAG: cytochrome c [Flexistipes sinusarabici]|uniref:Cytochrome c n=1 Tax=Flexistipes sinusarabici TaxID=2352 RepID=A0A5D0MN90_FLESI|nr:hypothetical protein [Flexistipes sinusarabici]TYB35104.1 MAG: cytochrome c [Flexistipes sinusarabici]
MKQLKLVILLLVTVVFFMSGYAMANKEVSNPEAKTKTKMQSKQITAAEINLPTEIRMALIKEMVKLETDMQELLSCLAKGQSKQAEETAMSIYQSFIMKQELSKKQLEKLPKLLPKDFVQLDRNFHKNAKQLAEAAGQNNFESAMNIYNQMTSACVTCHKNFAAKRFSGLAVQSN